MNINGYTPEKKLMSKQLITLKNVYTEDIFEILHLAREIKRRKAVGEDLGFLKNKHVVLLTKPSYVRTRIAFQIAMEELKGHPIVVSLAGSSIEEELKDPDSTATISNFGVSAFVVDTSFLNDAEVVKRYSDVPVINANGKSSPGQALSALLTIWEKKGKLQGLKIAVIGNTVESDYSLLFGASKCGMDISVISPKEFEPSLDVMNYCSQFGSIDVYDNVEDGIRGADVIYIMNNDFGREFMFTDRYLRFANKDALLLHSLPINRNVDISEEALNYSNACIYEQSGNILTTLEACLALIVGKIHD